MNKLVDNKKEVIDRGEMRREKRRWERGEREIDEREIKNGKTEEVR